MRIYLAIGAVVTIISLLVFIYIDGLKEDLVAAKESAKAWETSYNTEKENQKIYEELSLQQQEAISGLQKALANQTVIEKVQYEYITKYVDNPHVKASCGIPGEWVYQYNSAARLSAPTDYRSGADPTRERTYDDQIVLKVAIDNIHLYWNTRARYEALVKAHTEMVTTFNAKVTEINKQRGSTRK